MKDQIVSVESLKALAAILSLATSGLLAKKLVSDEAIDWRRFAGEWLLAIIGGIGAWSMGVLQGLTFMQMILVGTILGLGGVRTMEWIIKLVIHVRKMQ